MGYIGVGTGMVPLAAVESSRSRWCRWGRGSGLLFPSAASSAGGTGRCPTIVLCQPKEALEAVHDRGDNKSPLEEGWNGGPTSLAHAAAALRHRRHLLNVL